MISLPWIAALLGIGFVLGMWVGRKLSGKNIELTTEECVKVLEEKGYLVRLSSRGKLYK